MGVNNIWRELVVSPEEQEMVEEICRTGAGKSLAREELERFSVGREWDIEVDTRVGKTLVHMYWPEKTVEKERKIPLFINIHGGGFIKGRWDQDIVFCLNVCSRAHIAIADIRDRCTPATMCCSILVKMRTPWELTGNGLEPAVIPREAI